MVLMIVLITAGFFGSVAAFAFLLCVKKLRKSEEIFRKENRL